MQIEKPAETFKKSQMKQERFNAKIDLLGGKPGLLNIVFHQKRLLAYQKNPIPLPAPGNSTAQFGDRSMYEKYAKQYTPHNISVGMEGPGEEAEKQVMLIANLFGASHVWQTRYTLISNWSPHYDMWHQENKMLNSFAYLGIVAAFTFHSLEEAIGEYDYAAWNKQEVKMGHLPKAKYGHGYLVDGQTGIFPGNIQFTIRRSIMEALIYGADVVYVDHILVDVRNEGVALSVKFYRRAGDAGAQLADQKQTK